MVPANVGTWRAMSDCYDRVKCDVYSDVARHVPTFVRSQIIKTPVTNGAGKCRDMACHV
ncbi:MAG: hypothetical protein HDS16_04125 [Bacteroides sp.]|nr:hypothetical protein [Bacteroides sp.]